MVRAYYIKEHQLVTTENHELIRELKPGKIIWVDFEGADEQDDNLIQYFNIDKSILTLKADEIESSSRFYETEDGVVINTNMLFVQDREVREDILSVIIKNRTVFTFRRKNTTLTYEMEQRLRQIGPESMDSLRFVLALMDLRIDRDADIIESLARRITFLSKQISFNLKLEEEVIFEINQLQENFMILREALMEKQRILSSALKSDLFADTDYEKIRIMLKDVGSLVDHTSFNFERLDYLQNSFLGLINIEQNKVIKLFTVVTVIMMPPTLIASLYGMNFQFMPELNWDFGYPFAVILMIVSSLATLYYFKKKGWL